MALLDGLSGGPTSMKYNHLVNCPTKDNLSIPAYPLPSTFNPSSTLCHNNMLTFQLCLELAIAFSMLLGAILVVSVHHLPGSQPGR